MLPSIPRLEDYEISPVHGFLPDELPLERLHHAYYRSWEDVVGALQSLLLSRRLRGIVEHMPVLSTKHLVSQNEWRRAYVVLAFMTHAYIWGGDVPQEIVPPSIAKPFVEVCRHLDLPPVATYAGVCLWNFRPIFHDEPVDNLDNLATLLTFTGSMDESWFYLISVAIEARAAPVIPVMLDAIEAARQQDSLLVTACLQAFAERLDELGTLLNRMYEHCDSHVFYHRIRPFLAGSKNMQDAGLPRGVMFDESGTGAHEYVQYGGGSNAQSSVIQFFDLVLGVKHEPTGQHNAAGAPSLNFIHEMRKYMPGPHRRFLERVGEVANIRAYVEAHRDDGALTTAYDACLAMLRELRDRHIRMVSRYIIVKSHEAQRQAASTPGRESEAKQGRPINLANASSSGGGGGGGDNGAAIKRKLRGTGGTALIPFLKQAREETGIPAIGSWARRIMSNGPAYGVGGVGGRPRTAGFARLGKIDEHSDGKREMVGLAGIWSVDDSEGGICHCIPIANPKAIDQDRRRVRRPGCSVSNPVCPHNVNTLLPSRVARAGLPKLPLHHHFSALLLLAPPAPPAQPATQASPAQLRPGRQTPPGLLEQQSANMMAQLPQLPQLPPLTVSSSDGPYSTPRPDSLIEHAHRTTADATRATRIAQLLIDDITQENSNTNIIHSPTRRDYKMQHDQQQQQLPPIDPGDMSSMTSSEMSLREHLLAAQAGLTSHRPDSHSSHPGSPRDHFRQLDSTSPQAHHSGGPGTIDPAISGSGYGMAHVDHSMMDDEIGPDGKRILSNNTGKGRELSTSKRAAQNRAAQRAFRQRKEGYIKKLEEENRHMKTLIDESYAALQAENYQLRDYILTLQSRLGDYVSTSDIPQPQGIQLRDARTGEPLHHLHQMQAPAPQTAPAAQMLQTAQTAPHLQHLLSDLDGKYRGSKLTQHHLQHEPAQHHAAPQSHSSQHASLPPMSAGAVSQLQAAAAAANATAANPPGAVHSSSQSQGHTSSYPDYPPQITSPSLQQQQSDGPGRTELKCPSMDMKLVGSDDSRVGDL